MGKDGRAGEEEGGNRSHSFWAHKEAFVMLQMGTNENLNSRGDKIDEDGENLSKVGLSERSWHKWEAAAYRGFVLGTERKGKSH